MSEEVTRKLTAILAADVAGYSRLMGEDEAGTRSRFIAHLHELIEPAIASRRGRIVKTTGDALLVEFASVVDAVQCAVDIQKGMAERNADVPDDQRIVFRIGVNLGDVIIEGDDIHGDGVNVAARLEALADPGGVVVSGTVHEHVRGKLDFGFDDLGPQEVKNIAEPVRAYRVLPEGQRATTPSRKKAPSRWRIPAIAAAVVVVIAAGGIAWLQPWMPDVEPASLDKMAFKLPDKPSIAVLPFTNLSGDKEQEYFSDGLTEDIITNLASFPNLFVIARNSTAEFKSKAVDIRDVAHDLGVRYVLEGSVRRAGNTLRITAQLIDALSGNHIWAKSYDRELKDIFALQDEITGEIGSRLVSKVATAEFQRRSRRQTRSPEAYTLFLQGSNALQQSNPTSNAQAIRFFKQSITKDPNYGRAYALLGWAHRHNAVRGWGKSAEDTLDHALDLTKKGVALAPEDPLTNRYLSSVERQMRHIPEALAASEKAVALSPGDADTLMNYAHTLARAGRAEEAVRTMELALRLDPHGPFLLHMLAGIVFFHTRRYEKSIAAFERARRINPRGRAHAMALHAAAYAQLGKMDEARAAREAHLKLSPNYSISRARRTLGSWPPKIRKHAENSLRKAGFPENSPLELPKKPSIAVLPFTNMSGDKEQEYFSDGITEDIITDLSKVSGLFVIARTSTARYKGKAVDVRQIARELGVRYVVEGSVRKSADNVRITAQLIDATNGNHVWAERYDRGLSDVFAVQDDVSAKIVATLSVRLTAEERQRNPRKHIPKPEAHDLVLRGSHVYIPPTPKNLASARRLFERAIKLDLNYALAYSRLAAVLSLSVFSGASKSRAEDMEIATRMARKAISLDSSSGSPYVPLARLHLVSGRFDEAVREMENALRIEPGSAAVQWSYGYFLATAGRAAEGIPPTELALRLAPLALAAHSTAGATYYFAGRYADAIEHFERRESLGGSRANAPREALRAAAEMLAGKEEAARITVQKILQRRSGYTVRAALRSNRSKKSEDNDRLANALRRAGLPD